MAVGKNGDRPSVLVNVMSMSFTVPLYLSRLSLKEGLARPNSLAWKHSNDLRQIEMRY